MRASRRSCRMTRAISCQTPRAGTGTGSPGRRAQRRSARRAALTRRPSRTRCLVTPRRPTRRSRSPRGPRPPPRRSWPGARALGTDAGMGLGGHARAASGGTGSWPCPRAAPRTGGVGGAPAGSRARALAPAIRELQPSRAQGKVRHAGGSPFNRPAGRIASSARRTRLGRRRVSRDAFPYVLKESHK